MISLCVGMTCSAPYASPDTLVRRHRACASSRAGTVSALNRIGVPGVPGDMGVRDFAVDTSRGLAAAGVLLHAVVHFDLYTALCFGLAATALLWQSIRERAA
jgi:hypothetical protein